MKDIHTHIHKFLAREYKFVSFKYYKADFILILEKWKIFIFLVLFSHLSPVIFKNSSSFLLFFLYEFFSTYSK